MRGQVAVGEAVRAQGIAGGVRVRPWMEDVESYGRIREVYLKTDPARRLEVESFRRGGKGSMVWKFKGIDSIEAAEELRGAVFLVDRENLPGPDEGVYYWEDFEGREAVDESGRTLGRIVDMFGAKGNDVIVISTPEGGELLVPALREAVLRCEGNRWVFRPPEFAEEADDEEDRDAL
ncbi:ribosome maturation factor RimM [Nitrospinota bacterium]